MAGTRLCVAALAAGLISIPGARTTQTQTRAPHPQPDYDVRDTHAAARPLVTLDPSDGRHGRARINRESGSVRVLHEPDLALARTAGHAAIRALLASNARRLGLDPRDLATLTPVRDFVSRSNGVRHVEYRQVVDGRRVFDSSVAVHIRPDGTVARITSNAVPIEGRHPSVTLSDADARARAVSQTTDEGDPGQAELVWLAVAGTLAPAWHVTVAARHEADVYDVLVDANTAELLIRRNRVRQATGSGRILQSAGADPRRPDQMPLGPGGAACPPLDNYALHSLDAPFRDTSTVLANSGRLEGNNVAVFRGNSAVPASSGTFDGAGWLFDFPFNSAESAETSLFFAMNFAHDFFYDLGFDEAAGNFQIDNFGRGGLGGDPVKANARAAGRNNANYIHAPDGASPTINMFLWDGAGCWGQDVNGDGTQDLDGNYDLDIIVHEYHHGVSLRLNTSFTGTEAGAMGEGGGDFFAYSVNNDTVLAEFSRPGGLRGVNGKHYGDWTCLLGLYCEVHDNGEIWANVLWDARERFRQDLVRGSEAAAINEVHQLYVDALAISPPAPTMLDLRDAILDADALRNPGGQESQNYCRLWEAFAARGMGLGATDTSDNGFNRVGPDYDVPGGCTPPPSPPLVTVVASAPAAKEAGLVQGVLTFSRNAALDTALAVRYGIGGTAAPGFDYVTLSGTAVIPAGATSAAVAVVPIDDTLVENPDTVTVTIASGAGYVIGAPSSATISIESDDVAPDLLVTELLIPRTAGAGDSIEVTDTTRNQGLGSASSTQTAFYLSKNAIPDAFDPLLGSRTVPALATGQASVATTTLALPAPLEAGTYYLFAKSDAAGTIPESSEANNNRVATIAVGPDLTVTSITAPGTAAPGGSIAVAETTSNTGAGPAGASATRFYLSNNVFLDAADPALDARSVGPLAPGASSTSTTMVTIPGNTPAGTYYLFAEADAGDAVTEASEINNSRAVLIKIGADLTVSSLTVPNRAGSGQTILITDTTRNIGSGGATPSATAFYLSANFILDAADVRLGTARPVPALAAAESSTATTSVVLPDISAGTWIIIANADDGRAVVETQETNNARFATLLVGPDLNFLTVTAPSSGAPGASVNVNAVMRNTGGGTAAASVIRYYLSTDALLDAGDLQLNAVRTVVPLAPDATANVSMSVPLPSDRTGLFYLLVVADGDKTVAEANELNNVAARFIQINGG